MDGLAGRPPVQPRPSPAPAARKTAASSTARLKPLTGRACHRRSVPPLQGIAAKMAISRSFNLLHGKSRQGRNRVWRHTRHAVCGGIEAGFAGFVYLYRGTLDPALNCRSKRGFAECGVIES